MSAGEWERVNDTVPCRKCTTVGQIKVREWESSCGGFEDLQYRCDACGKDWWIEGSDA